MFRQHWQKFVTICLYILSFVTNNVWYQITFGTKQCLVPIMFGTKLYSVLNSSTGWRHSVQCDQLRKQHCTSSSIPNQLKSLIIFIKKLFQFQIILRSQCAYNIIRKMDLPVCLAVGAHPINSGIPFLEVSDSNSPILRDSVLAWCRQS